MASYCVRPPNVIANKRIVAVGHSSSQQSEATPAHNAMFQCGVNMLLLWSLAQAHARRSDFEVLVFGHYLNAALNGERERRR